MGIGDEIMACGEARLLHEQTGKRVCITDVNGKPRKNTFHVWDEVPFLSPRLDPGVIQIVNEPGRRPYVERWIHGERLIFRKDYRAKPAVLIHEECPTPEPPYIVIEPAIKGKCSANNKDWGRHNWTALVDELRKLMPIYQFQHEFTGRPIDGVQAWRCDTFRQSANTLSLAKLFIGTDGALHHASAALGTPGVVIWGGYSSPHNLGYGDHVNIYHDHELSPCGSLRACSHCREAMNRITPAEVFEAAKGALCKEQ